MTPPPRDGAPGTLLEAELREQPEVIARLVDRAPDEVRTLRRLTSGTAGVVVAARGSSDNAARYAQYLLPLRTGLPVGLAAPSLSTVYGRAPDVRGATVVAISQSGASPDVVAVLADARAQGCPTVAITNDPGSALAAQADHVLDMATGPERSVAATKTYTASLLGVALLALAMGAPDDEPEALRELAALPSRIAEAIRPADAAAVAQRLSGLTRAVAVGRGLNLCTAHEAALKITELTRALVIPYSPADLRHGPIAAVGPDTPVLLVAPDEPASASVRDLVPALRERGAPVVVLGPGADLPVPAEVPGWLSPLVCAVPAQALAWQLAVTRGVDIDHPGGLSKITTTR
ncbi:SIS domain-containing protein [Pseudonocardia sp. KRD291]|uniref:SIS domain-containing protein n=1 Tax=Pseudonocardia sp. KRD291 TaxID=2792007 RepID=UPI001C49F2E2|nr:SIS domain-containing protein [Pseudonocardia sp. KRD291]MBW0101076.1 SIS domain-containing protein [Pseudonocardia sp. KRD291]